MEDCPCLVVSLRVFLLLFLCCCHFFPLLFVFVLIVFVVTDVVAVAICGGAWCILVPGVGCYVGHHCDLPALTWQDGKTVKLFDLRQWLMKEKVGTSCHPT